MMDSRPSARTTFIAFLALWIVWLVSAFPLFVLFLEFRCGEIGECGAEWWYYARYHSNIFLYPVFGFISTALLHRPWIRTFHYLFSLPEPTRTKLIGVVVVLGVLVVGLFIYGEFLSKHSSSAFKNCKNVTEFKFKGAAPAPWFIAPSVMEAKDEGKGVRSLLEERCKRPSQSLQLSEKCEFQEQLSVLWKDRNRSASYTYQSYFYGTVAMTILFVFLGATIVIMGTSKSMKDSAGGRSSEDKHMKTLLVNAYQFAMFWALMRVAVLRENQSLYVEDPLLDYNYVILLLFAIGFVAIVIVWPDARPYERYRANFLSIASSAITVVGLFGDRFVSEWIPDVLVGYFGTGGSLLSYLIVLAFLLVVYSPYIVRYVLYGGEDSKSDDAGGRGAT